MRPRRERTHPDKLLKIHHLYSVEPHEFRPLHDGVLVKLQKRRNETDAGLVTVETAYAEVQMEAVVAAVGSGVHGLSPGDKVVCIHDVLSDHIYKFHGSDDTYEVLPQEQILAVVE